MENCIYCGNEIPKGTGHKVLDENYNDTREKECDKCFSNSMQIDENDL